MLKRLNPLLGALVLFGCLHPQLANAQAETPGRHLTVDDVVELEAFGRAAISPDGRWAVYEKRGGYDTATRYDYASRAAWTIMDLWVADLADPGPTPQRLLPGEGPGLQRMAWSPDSTRLLVSRLRDGALEVGVVSIEGRTVQWTGLTPEMPRTGATVEWASSEEFVLSIRPDGTLPELLRHDSGAQSRMSEAWSRSAEGRLPSRTVLDTDQGLAAAEASPPPGALVVVNARTGARRTLGHGRVVDFAVAPDGHTVAVVSAREPSPLATGRVTLAESPNRQRLSLIRLEDAAVVEPLAGHDLASALLRWSPDSQAVLVWARQDGAEWDEGALIEARWDGVQRVDLGGLSPGSVDQVVNGVRADWLGRHPVIYARPSADARYDWYRPVRAAAPVNLTARLRSPSNRLAASTPGDLKLFADGSLWAVQPNGAERLGLDGSELQAVWPSDAEQVRRLGWNEAPRRDWVAAADPAGNILIVSPQGVKTLGPGPSAATRNLAVSRASALVLERKGLEETLWLRAEGFRRRLDAVNSGKRDVTLIEPQPISHVDVHGREARSWLYLPPDRSPEAIRSVILNVYPGSADNLVWSDPLTMTYGIRATVLAAAGFAVLSASLPGDAAPSDRGALYVKAADLAADAALAAYPELPADRLAVYGHSFGGYAAMEIATRSSRYRSYIASSGMYDWTSHWGQIHPATRIQPEDGLRFRQMQAYVETGQGRLAAPPWGAGDEYRAASPYLRAEDVDAPVLLLTADLDFVPMTHAEAMFSALYRHGKRARLITYWGEKHHAWSPANIRDQYKAIFDWLDETLPPLQATISSPASAAAPMSAPRTRTPPPP